MRGFGCAEDNCGRMRKRNRNAVVENTVKGPPLRATATEQRTHVVSTFKILWK
jgi:hypothetical protein